MGIITQIKQPVAHAPVVLIRAPVFQWPGASAGSSSSPKTKCLIPPTVAIRVLPATILPGPGTEVFIFDHDTDGPTAWVSNPTDYCLGPVVETQRECIAMLCQELTMGICGVVLGCVGDSVVVVRLTVDAGE